MSDDERADYRDIFSCNLSSALWTAERKNGDLSMRFMHKTDAGDDTFTELRVPSKARSWLATRLRKKERSK